jgi:hypothetical protein
LQASQLTDIIMPNQLSLGCTPLHRLDYNILRRRSMKPVKNSVFALLLVFAITANVAAGEMPIPPGPNPTQPHATATAPADSTDPSLDPNSEQSGETVESSDYLLFEALAALLYLY